MRQFLLLSAVVLVFVYHQGYCWPNTADAPYSAVRHLGDSRQLADTENELENDLEGGKLAASRHAVSLELSTVAPISTTQYVKFQSNMEAIANSGDLAAEKRKHKGKKMRNKKKKKKKNMSTGEGDESFSWNNSHMNMSLGLDDGNNIPGVWTTGERRRKHRNKLKKERRKQNIEETEEDNLENKPKYEKPRKEKKEKSEKLRKEKSEKSLDEKVKKEKKRRKEKKKQKEKTATNKLEKNQNGGDGLPVEISSKSKPKNKLKHNKINHEFISSSTEYNVEALPTKEKQQMHLNIEKNNDDSLETIKNEINAGEFSDKLFPLLYTPKEKDSFKTNNDDSEYDNKLSFKIPSTDKNDRVVQKVKNYSQEFPNKNDISTKSSVPASENSINDTHSLISTDKKAAKPDVTTIRNDISPEGKEIELHTIVQIDMTTQPTNEGDLSCLSGVFLPAPPVPNAEIKYIRGKYLEAEYECLPDYKLVPEDAPRLVCNQRQWLGDLPQCLPTSNSSYRIFDGLKNSSSCGNSRGGCEQLCSLVDDKPVCSCFRGFKLQGSTCQDIDECTNFNGGCEVSCHNKPGSYHCGCPIGFRLAANGKSCLDINECLLRNGHGPCQDTCHNLPGGYRCSCEGIEGTSLATDNHTCEDLDECARNNAGCSHTCLNTLGRAFCLCPPGFMLGTDWKTCHDIDECADPDLQEGERCSIGCVNTMGSYQCIELRDQAPNENILTTEEPKTSTTAALHTTAAPAVIKCLPGFEIGPFGSCRDIDECETNNGGCSHTCKNTLGSVFCLCPPGFMLADDWKTCKAMDVRTTETPKLPVTCSPGFIPSSGGRCKDIDECAFQNGGCMQGCVNIRGSFRCVCGRGFFLAADGRSCVEERVDIVCPPLPTPSYGYLHCTRRVFMVAPETWRARWRRRIVNHAGAVCELRCPHGYKVHGEYRKVCEADGNWAGPEDGFCMPFPKPKIECPHNITMEIEPGQKTAFVAFPQPVTDVDWFRNVVSKPSWGKLLEADLPLGHWSVTFTARHPISRHTASCTLTITISSSKLSTEVPKELA